MDFEDPYALKAEQEPYEQPPSSLGPKAVAPLLQRVSDLESAVEAAIKAFAGVYDRLQTLEKTLGL